jgi:hypothetical protein
MAEKKKQEEAAAQAKKRTSCWNKPRDCWKEEEEKGRRTG